MKNLFLTLPWPPSVNHYYGRARSGRVFLKPAGRSYRKKVAIALASYGWPRVEGNLHIDIHLVPPDKRRRDIDNVKKALFDALSDRHGHHGVMADDAQIREEFTTFSQETDPDGLVKVYIREMEK